VEDAIGVGDWVGDWEGDWEVGMCFWRLSACAIEGCGRKGDRWLWCLDVVGLRYDVQGGRRALVRDFSC